MDPGRSTCYEFDGAAWVEMQLLTQGGEFARFGSSVAIADDRILVGQPGDHSQRAYFYERDGTGMWNMVASFLGVTYEGLGGAVAIDGDRAVVGAPTHIGPPPNDLWRGAAYAYGRDAQSEWVLDEELTPQPLLELGTEFGGAVAIDGDRIAVGGRGRNGQHGRGFRAFP